MIKIFWQNKLPRPLNKHLYGKPLGGRWSIDYCTKNINNKIDLSNEDHCGPCGQYTLDKIKNKNEFYDKL
jgi:hypothetical protein